NPNRTAPFSAGFLSGLRNHDCVVDSLSIIGIAMSRRRGLVMKEVTIRERRSTGSGISDKGGGPLISAAKGGFWLARGALLSCAAADFVEKALMTLGWHRDCP
ncbi:hypothetical protein KEM55_009135, partial [Ascosphaera atra]